jgi:hypothetical protein
MPPNGRLNINLLWAFSPLTTSMGKPEQGFLARQIGFQLVFCKDKHHYRGNIEGIQNFTLLLSSLCSDLLSIW